MEKKETILNPISNHQIKNLIGKTFGRLKVVKLDTERMRTRISENKRPKTYWICECSCGNKTSVEGNQMISGKTTSCGCFKKENTHNIRFKDLTGLKFGRLTVLKLDIDRMNIENNKVTYWLCKCDCEKHNIISVNGGNLNNGHTQSCGCLNYESLQETYRQKAINGNSFAQYLIDTYGDNALELYWSDKNILNPWEINKMSSTIDIYLNCQDVDYHKGYKTVPVDFVLGGGCAFCHVKQIHPKDSFAQWGIDNFGEDFLEIYWSDKNILNPFELSKNNKEKIFIKCQEKDYHKDYETTCGLFHMGARCPYCVNRKVHPKDSLGQYIVDNFGKDFLNNVWSEKNDKSAFEYSPSNKTIVWWKCHDNKHEDYQRTIDQSKRMDFRCPSCTNIKGELQIEEILNKYNLLFKQYQKYDDLLGVGGKSLSYDFYLFNYNLLIEYQGQQHYEPIEYFGGQEQFEKQVEHDKRKREYAEYHSIPLLPIPYWDFDNIEEIILEKLSKLELTKAI